MRKNRVKELWRAGQPVVTGWCGTPDPYTTEIMIRAGFDALVLDTQHGMGIGPDRAVRWLQIVSQSEVTPLVRIAWNEPAFAQWVLDAGAMGVIIPMVNDVEEAKKAIGACRYPPTGYRSFGPNRAKYAHGSDYGARANEEIICLVMMETVEGIASIDEIAKLPGLDGYYIGPQDLCLSIGIAPTLDARDPQHVAAVQKVIDVAKKHGQNAGIHLSGPEEGIRRWKQGFNLNPVCSEVNLIAAGASRAISVFREGISE